MKFDNCRKIPRNISSKIHLTIVVRKKYRNRKNSELPASDVCHRAAGLDAGSDHDINHDISHMSFDISDLRRSLEISRKEVANLRAEISAIHSSKSWRITAPLRTTVRLWKNLTNMSGARSASVSITRKIYQRSRLLHSIRSRYVSIRAWIVSEVEGGWNRRENLLAIRALTERRFINKLDLKSPEFASDKFVTNDLPMLDMSIVTYNSKNWIRRFLTSLERQRYPLDRINIIIVDNGSVDDSIVEFEDVVEELSLKFASTKIIRQANNGFGRGHDRAIRLGYSKYILVTNVDIEFQDDSLTTVVNVALGDRSGEIASWELRQIPYEHPKYYDPVTLETNWCAHACVLIRRDAYLAVGGYEPRIFMYAEDVELSYRFRSYGYRLMYVPNAVIRHDSYRSAAEVKPVQWLGSTLGNLYLRARYGDRKTRVVGLMQYVALFALPAPFQGARRGLIKNAWKVLRNWKYFRSGKRVQEVYFPFRNFDYELRREGAFFENEISNLSEYPLVTIITRTYEGREVFLRQALESVKNQTYQNLELIIVQDGGSSLEYLVRGSLRDLGCDRSYQFIPSPKLGRSSAGNIGLAAARGEFLMFLDDDDLLFSDHVSTLIHVLVKKPKISAVYGLSMQIETTIDIDGDHYIEEGFGTPPVFFQEWDYRVLLDHNYMPIQAVMFRRELYEERGGFDLSLDQLEDWHLWIRYGYRNIFEYIPKTTSLFRVPGSQEVRCERARKLHDAYGGVKESALARLKDIDRRLMGLA